jgi:hypothetical protein
MLRKVIHVRQQKVFGNFFGGTGGDVFDHYSLGEPNAFRKMGLVSAGVDGYLVAQSGELCCEGGDVDVLTAGVDSTKCRKRARVFRHHGDLHRHTSSIS